MKTTRASRTVLVGVSLLVFLGLWEGVVRLADYPPFLLPAPGDVLRRLAVLLADGSSGATPA